MSDGLHQLLADGHRVLVAFLSLGVKDPSTLFHQLPFPVANKGLVDFVSSEFRELLLALDRRDGD